MKYLLHRLLIVLLLAAKQASAQDALSFDTCLARGKAIFKLDFDQQDYSKAAAYLEKAVALRPDNMEAHYFLGYAYSRINGKDASQIPGMQVSGTWKLTREMQTVIRTTPRYTGEIVALDPYIKLTGEWGSLALCYAMHHKTDSLHWALRTAKEQGAFAPFSIAYAKALLDNCSPNAILFTSGDNVTLPVFYAQQEEHYRTDVTAIDVSMLATTWYPVYLTATHPLNFGLHADSLAAASFSYCDWEPHKVRAAGKQGAPSLEWLVPCGAYDGYLMRDERLILALIQANFGMHEFFFTTGVPDADLVGLSNQLVWLGSLRKLVPGTHTEVADKVSCKTALIKLLANVHLVNKNSDQELLLVNEARLYTFYAANYYKAKDKRFALELIALADRYAPAKDYPYNDPEAEKWTAGIRAGL